MKNFLNLPKPYQNETRTIVVLILFLLSFSFSAWATEENYFNEIVDQSGLVRAEYYTAEQLWKSQSEEQRKQFLEDSKVAFQGDNMLDPMPRIFTSPEYDEVLKKGIHQRAAAVQAFLRDYYSGKNRFVEGNVIPVDTLERIISRHSEEGYKGVINPSSISFIYGPDIIRDSEGQFRVVEDNPGFIGGLGDLKLAQEHMLSQKPELLEQAEFRSAEEFYQKLGERYKARALKHKGIAIIYMIPPFVDNEDKRIKNLFKDQGIEVVTPYTNNQMLITNNGVYLTRKNDPKFKQKVGMVALNGELYWLDPSQPQNRNKLLATIAKDLLKGFEAALPAIENIRKELRKTNPDKKRIDDLIKQLPYVVRNGKTLAQELIAVRKQILDQNDLLDRLKAELQSQNTQYENMENIIRQLGYGHWISQALYKARMAKDLTKQFIRGQVDINTSPGLDFIGDKEFYLYVENMIRFYLNEEPIIKNIRTGTFLTKDGRLNRQKLEKVIKQKDKFVIKKVDGRGGDAVWVGPKTSPETLEDVRAQIIAEPEKFIEQDFTPLSRLHDNIVDVRVITDVGPDSIFVTDTPWGRGLPSDGDGKVNISKEGREVTVLVEKPGTKVRCEILFLR
jgi:uncharacterized circularly permuted ATP-grasp superfamily protein